MVPILRRSAVGLGLIVLILVGTPGVASAHAQLESTSPSQGAVLLVPPSQVVLHFGEPVEIDFGSVRVIGPGGGRVDGGGTHHPNGDSHSVAVSLPVLADGTYVVAWRVISADSHPVHGAFVFSVGSASGAAKADALALGIADQSGSAPVGVLYWLVRTVAFVGLLFLVGPAMLIATLWRDGGRARRVRALLWWSWSLLLAATVVGIAVQGVYASALPLTDILRPSLFADVLHTRFGEVALLRLLLLAAFLPVLVGIGDRWGSGPSRWRWVLPATAVLGLGLVATPGLAGHAGTGGSPAAGLALDVVHVAAAAVWLGGLALLATFVFAGFDEEDLPADPMVVTHRVSSAAFVAVSAIVATGVFQSIRQVGSLYALVHTTYGTTLLIKIAMVTVLVAVGAVSRRIVHGSTRGALRAIGPSPATTPSGGGEAPIGPRVDPTEPAPSSGGGSAVVVEEQTSAPGAPTFPRRRLRRSLAVELAIAIAVLAVTALLVNDVPARQAVALPYSSSFTTLGVQVNTVIDPARVGPTNQVHVYVLSSLGAPKAIPELDVSLSLPSSSIGPITVPLIISGPGHYYAAGVDFAVAGTWTIRYTVRIDAIDENVVTSEITVH